MTPGLTVFHSDDERDDDDDAGRAALSAELGQLVRTLAAGAWAVAAICLIVGVGSTARRWLESRPPSAPPPMTAGIVVEAGRLPWAGRVLDHAVLIQFDTEAEMFRAASGVPFAVAPGMPPEVIGTRDRDRQGAPGDEP